MKKSFIFLIFCFVAISLGFFPARAQEVEVRGERSFLKLLFGQKTQSFTQTYYVNATLVSINGETMVLTCNHCVQPQDENGKPGIVLRKLSLIIKSGDERQERKLEIVKQNELHDLALLKLLEPVTISIPPPISIVSLLTDREIEERLQNARWQATLKFFGPGSGTYIGEVWLGKTDVGDSRWKTKKNGFQRGNSGSILFLEQDGDQIPIGVVVAYACQNPPINTEGCIGWSTTNDVIKQFVGEALTASTK